MIHSTLKSNHQKKGNGRLAQGTQPINNIQEEKNKICHLLTEHPITPCMGREWLVNKSLDDSQPSSLGESNLGFTIITYNILAQMYAKRLDMEPFNQIPNYEMTINWSYRRKRIFREIKSYEQPEIICFQECDNYKKYWRSKMNNKLNMYSTYSEKKGKYNGCATFWKTDRFVEVTHQYLDLSFLSKFIDQGRETNFMFGRRDTANLTLLQCTLSSKYLLVINNHLAWDPDFPQVKLSQMLYILQMARTTIQPYLNGSLKQQVSVVLTGDFNSLPGSEVYNLIVEGQAEVPSAKHLSFNPGCTIFTDSSVRTIGGKKERKQVMVNPFGKFKSCYHQVRGNEPSFTNYNSGFSGTLDYIFTVDVHELDSNQSSISSTSSLISTKVLDGITEEKATVHKCLPSLVFPSDHIPLSAHLTWQ